MYMQMGGNAGDGATLARQTGASQAAKALGVASLADVTPERFAQQGGALPATARLLATQVNHESIHAHDVVATRAGSIRDLRDELGIDTPPSPA